MRAPVRTEIVARLAPLAEGLVTDWARRLPGLRHADLRLEVVESKYALAENGAAKGGGDDAAVTLDARVLAGTAAVAPGYFGRSLGTADLDGFEDLARRALAAAHRRAVASAEAKARSRRAWGPLGACLADTVLAPVPASRDVVPAVCRIDPRETPLPEMIAYTTDVSRRLAALPGGLDHNYVATLTQLARELFVSSEGARIDQATALTSGYCSVVASGPGNSQELHDVLGHQRGWEILEDGIADPLMPRTPFADFAAALGREARELSQAPPLPAVDGPVVVVIDTTRTTARARPAAGSCTSIAASSAAS
jgi:predicted Zn-dependent protease